MGNERLALRLSYPATEAVHLLLHHVHGGLHNAAMSLQLAGEGGRASSDLQLVAQSGLEGIAQAARGVSLLTVLFGLVAGSGHAPADRQWVELVEALLRQRANDRQVDLAIEPDLAPREGGAPDAEALAATLLDGIEAIDAASPGERVRLPRLAIARTA